MPSGVLGIQHVDVASGRARELRERPQVVLSGIGPFSFTSLLCVRLLLCLLFLLKVLRFAHGDGIFKIAKRAD